MGRLAKSLDQNKPSRKKALVFAELMAKTIRSVCSPAKIIVFGSVVSGDFGSGSDIDLMLVFADENELKSGRKKIHKIVIKKDYPIDYLFITQQRFDAEKDTGGVCFVANKEGLSL